MIIEHIALYVQDLQVSKHFYESYFGAVSSKEYHNKSTGFKSYFLSFEGGARLELMSSADHCEKDSNEKRAGFIHLAFSVGSEEQVRSLTVKLKQDGYNITSEPRTTGDGYYESCVADPEGNLIEITV